MVSTLEEIRAFCKKHGIKFTVVPGRAKPWVWSKGRTVKIGPECWPFLKNPPLYIKIPETSLQKYFDDCEELSRKHADSNYREEIRAFAAAGRDVLSRGDVDRAIQIAAALGSLLERPDAETGRRIRDTVRKIHQDRYGTPEQKAERWAA